jgi:hypothetical protein
LHQLRAGALVFLRRWKEALLEFQQALELKPLVSLRLDIGQCKRNIPGMELQALDDFQYFIDNADVDDRNLPSGKSRYIQ